jgi:hypothetical protein
MMRLALCLGRDLVTIPYTLVLVLPVVVMRLTPHTVTIIVNQPNPNYFHLAPLSV